MRFSIANWRAISPYYHSHNDWINWVEKGFTNKNELAQSVNLSFLPAMKRRRLSPLARLMFSAAWPLVEEAKHCPLVFVSHDGEVNRSLELWLSLLGEEAISPTSFALSVHNAVAGQWSLMRQDMSETVALSASTNALEVAMVEACGLLASGHNDVLVVVADEPLNYEYPITAMRAPFEYALALLVTAGDDWELIYHPNQSPDSHSKHESLSNSSPLFYYSSALNWIKNQLSTESLQACSWSEPALNGLWQWNRGAL